jgi:hypothetical protein
MKKINDEFDLTKVSSHLLLGDDYKVIFFKFSNEIIPSFELNKLFSNKKQSFTILRFYDYSVIGIYHKYFFGKIKNFINKFFIPFDDSDMKKLFSKYSFTPFSKNVNSIFNNIDSNHQHLLINNNPFYTYFFTDINTFNTINHHSIISSITFSNEIDSTKINSSLMISTSKKLNRIPYSLKTISDQSYFYLLTLPGFEFKRTDFLVESSLFDLSSFLKVNND